MGHEVPTDTRADELIEYNPFAMQHLTAAK